MVPMSQVQKWWSRAAAAVTGLVLTLIVPVHAWAVSTGADQIAYEAARRGRRGGGFFIIGAVCCLVVVGAVVVAVLLISRNRKRKG